jgi:hypothetical protein
MSVRISPRIRRFRFPAALGFAAALGVAPVVGSGTVGVASARPTESAGEEVTLRLGYFPNVTHAPAIVGVDTGAFQGQLHQQRFAYVAVSRGQYDARIYTVDKAKLARALGRDVSHRSALERTPAQASRQSESRESARSESAGHSMAVGST